MKTSRGKVYEILNPVIQSLELVYNDRRRSPSVSKLKPPLCYASLLSRVSRSCVSVSNLDILKNLFLVVPLSPLIQGRQLPREHLQ